MLEYKLLRLFYGEAKAERSQVPLINHIEEGIIILKHLKAESVTIRAYCLHPLLQSDSAFLKHKACLPPQCIDAAILAMEYRRVANSYLSHMAVASLGNITCENIRQMLIADKVQNYKDFLIHHSATHPRALILDGYFNSWFKILGINYADYSPLIK